MTNLEKLFSVGKIVYGDNWQSPLSRDLSVSDRTIRNFVSGASRPPIDLSSRLLVALEKKMSEIQQAVNVVNADKMTGDDVTIELIADIAERYEYRDEQDRKNAIDEMNNAVYPETFLSDIEQIAQKWALTK